MKRTNDTLFREWVMLTNIPRYPRKITVSELKQKLIAEGYDANIRTIQRNLIGLSTTFPLTTTMEGRTNHWYWMKDAPSLMLPGIEPITALVFEMARGYLSPLLPTATLDLLNPYFSTAGTVLDEQKDSSLGSWANKVAVIERGPNLLPPSINEEIQSVIYQALLEEKTIKASYTKLRQQASDYLLHPLAIVSRLHVIYLLATSDNDKDTVKQFALHRFNSAIKTNDSRRQKEDFSLQDFIHVEKKFLFPLKTAAVQLKVLFDPETAAFLEETPLSDHQTLTKQDDGRILLETEVIDSIELRRWLQGFGESAEVLKPVDMRNEFSQTFKKLAALYSNN